VTIAVIFIPAVHQFATYADQCLAYCAHRGYEVAGVVTGDWAAAAAMLIGRTAGVLVVARPDHLDPDREPRIEVVDQGTSHATPPRNAGPVARRHRRPNQV
jgi:hypothetical protein